MGCPHWPRLDVFRSLVCKLLESELQQQELQRVSGLQGDDSETEQDPRSTADGGRRRRLIITLPEVRRGGGAGVPLASLRLVMSANDPPGCG